MQNKNWTKITQTTPIPPGRRSHRAVAYKDHMFIFGNIFFIFYVGFHPPNNQSSLPWQTIEWQEPLCAAGPVPISFVRSASVAFLSTIWYKSPVRSKISKNKLQQIKRGCNDGYQSLNWFHQIISTCYHTLWHNVLLNWLYLNDWPERLHFFCQAIYYFGIMVWGLFISSLWLTKSFLRSNGGLNPSPGKKV